MTYDAEDLLVPDTSIQDIHRVRLADYFETRLPNHLTVEQIRFGLSNIRNPIIASHATQQMPYRGLGSGIPRALESYALIQFIDDREGNQFKVIMQRPQQDKS